MGKTQEKTYKISKAMSIFLKLGWILSSIVALLAAVGIGVLLLADSGTQQSLLGAFVVTGANSESVAISMNHLLLLLGALFAAGVFMVLILHGVYTIFRDISRERKPFCSAHVARIKYVAFLIIAMCVANNIFNEYLEAHMTSVWSWKIDLSGILLGAIVYCLSYIFQCGCELQEQVDRVK